eukprot:scpid81945/ scgid6297/ 
MSDNAPSLEQIPDQLPQAVLTHQQQSFPQQQHQQQQHQQQQQQQQQHGHPSHALSKQQMQQRRVMSAQTQMAASLPSSSSHAPSSAQTRPLSRHSPAPFSSAEQAAQYELRQATMQLEPVPSYDEATVHAQHQHQQPSAEPQDLRYHKQQNQPGHSLPHSASAEFAHQPVQGQHITSQRHPPLQQQQQQQ